MIIRIYFVHLNKQLSCVVPLSISHGGDCLILFLFLSDITLPRPTPLLLLPRLSHATPPHPPPHCFPRPAFHHPPLPPPASPALQVSSRGVSGRLKVVHLCRRIDRQKVYLFLRSCTQESIWQTRERDHVKSLRDQQRKGKFFGWGKDFLSTEQLRCQCGWECELLFLSEQWLEARVSNDSTVVQHLHGQRTGRVIQLLNAVFKRFLNIYINRVVREVYERTHG